MMRPDEISKVQGYLRKLLSNNRLSVIAPARADGPVELHLADEFIGVVHRDEDEGEVSYSVVLTILDIDLEDV